MLYAASLDVVKRLFSIADLPGDDDDVRLRKRAGVAGGLATIVAPLSLPLEDGLVGIILGFGLSLYSSANLLVLARTKRFERYVIALIASGPPFVLAANVLAGGVLSNGGGLVWAFLIPAYALLALGPRRATPWFVLFLARRPRLDGRPIHRYLPCGPMHQSHLPVYEAESAKL